MCLDCHRDDFYSTMEFKNRGKEWHHQRKKSLRMLLRTQTEENIEMRKHISGDVGLMAFDKDSQSLFL